MVRLQKFLAEAGVASRRASEKLILQGAISVNGRVITELGSKIDPQRDRITVGGKVIRTQRKLYLALNKPRGCVCSRKDEHGRPTIYELLPKEWTSVYSVGRLDFASEGLIFLTNDGEFALRLTHPRFGVRKRYLVTIAGRVEAAMLEDFTRGVFHEGERLKAERAWPVSEGKVQSVVELELAEGKNREVRRLFESKQLTVRQLVRTQIGKIKLGELKAGRWRTLSPVEIKSLMP